MYLEMDDMIVCDVCQDIEQEAKGHLLILREMFVTPGTGDKPGGYSPNDRLDLCKKCFDQLRLELNAQRSYLRRKRLAGAILAPPLLRVLNESEYKRFVLPG